MIHNLQVFQSGPDLSMVHRRPTLRRIEKGDPVYMCFCPFTLFKQIKLGFDREYFVGGISDEHARIYDITLDAQAAALEMIRPGIPAEERDKVVEGFDVGLEMSGAPEALNDMLDNICHGGKIAMLGIPAEEVHFAALDVYQTAGFGICYRTGRGVGYSYLECPEFKDGDKTILQAGMTFAVDGGITIEGEFGARVGDSIVVTEDGFEYLTPYPKQLRIL